MMHVLLRARVVNTGARGPDGPCRGCRQPHEKELDHLMPGSIPSAPSRLPDCAVRARGQRIMGTTAVTGMHGHQGWARGVRFLSEAEARPCPGSPWDPSTAVFPVAAEEKDPAMAGRPFSTSLVCCCCCCCCCSKTSPPRPLLLPLVCEARQESSPRSPRSSTRALSPAFRAEGISVWGQFREGGRHPQGRGGSAGGRGGEGGQGRSCWAGKTQRGPVSPGTISQFPVRRACRTALSTELRAWIVVVVLCVCVFVCV